MLFVFCIFYCTASHWFPYIIKRIPIIEELVFEISPIEVSSHYVDFSRLFVHVATRETNGNRVLFPTQVAIEAIDKKTADLVEELHRETPDLVKIELILQGSISAQV